MFSYNKPNIINQNIQNNQNYMISQIQGYASEIFRSHTTSKADQQQMSLELSPTTSQQYQEGQIDRQNQQQNAFQKLVPFIFQQISSNNIKKENPDVNRMSKSVISQPISNMKVKQNNNKSKNHNKPDQRSQYERQMNLARQVLKRSSINLNNVSHQNIKAQHKKSSNYVQNYISPYSSKSFKINSKSYMQKSHSKTKNYSKEYEKVKQKLNDHIEPHISYRKQNSGKQNEKMKNIKSKYRQQKPILSNCKTYVNENIIKKMRIQSGHFSEIKKGYSTISQQQLQSNWQNFLSRQSAFKQQKNQKILKKQLEISQKQANFSSKLPQNRFSESLFENPIAQFYIKNIKRQKQRLEERLQSNSVHNFMQRSYEDDQQSVDDAYKNVFGNKFNHEKSKITGVEDFSTIKERASTGFQKRKIGNENFFKSAEDHSEPFQSDASFLTNNVEKLSYFESLKKQNSQNASMKKPHKIANFKPIDSSRKLKTEQVTFSQKDASPFSKKKQSISSNLNNFSKKSNNYAQNSYPHQSYDVNFNSRHTQSALCTFSNSKGLKNINQLEQYSTRKSKDRKRVVEFSSSNIKSGGLSSHQKHIISNFDQNLLRKTVQDVERKIKQEFRQLKSKQVFKNYDFSNSQIQRKNQQSLKQNQPFSKKKDERDRSRSVSPIFQQNTISNIQMSGIRNQRQGLIKLLKDRVSHQNLVFQEKPLSTSLIMAKTPSEIKFYLQNDQKQSNSKRQAY